MSDRESIDERIERIEAEQEELQQTVRKMLPSRRAVLKGGATALGTGMLGYSAGSASADASTSDTDGNLGTPSDRWDVFADGVDAKSVSTDELSTKEQPVIDATYFGADPTGSNDSGPAIRDAIDHASSLGGGTVYLPSGTFKIGDVSGSSAIPLHNDNIALRGAGRYQTVLRSHFDMEQDVYGTNLHSALISAYGTSTELLTNVHISDIGIEVVDNWPNASIVGDYLEYSTVERIWIDNKTQLLSSGTSGIPVWWGRSENEQRNRYLAIRDCEILSGSSNNPALEMSGTDYGVVSGNVIDATDGEAAVKVEGSRNITVTNNSAETKVDSINFLSTQECVCANNSIRSLEDKGVTVGGDDSVNSRHSHTIANNTIQSSSYGIWLASGVTRTAISSNTITGSNIGIRLSTAGINTVINGNTVHGCSSHALANDGGVQALDGVVIANNHFKNSGAEGVRLYSPRNGRGVVLSGNVIEKVGSWSTDYILVTENSSGDAVSGMTITSNHCSQAGADINIPSNATNFVVATNLSSINYGGSTSSTEIVANNAG